MQVKTRAIVLHYIRYRESSIICKVFTEEMGLKSYVLNGIRKAGGKSNKTGLFQALSLLDMVVYENPKSDLHRVLEYQTAVTYGSIPFIIKKTTIAVFLAEVISKCLRENHQEPQFFSFLFEALKQFDKESELTENFHLLVLFELCEAMGVGLKHAEEDYKLTDVHGGMSTNWQRFQDHIGSMAATPGQSMALQINQHDRRELLRLILYHLSHHQVLQGNIKSLQVLQTVFG